MSQLMNKRSTQNTKQHYMSIKNEGGLKATFQSTRHVAGRHTLGRIGSIVTAGRHTLGLLGHHSHVPCGTLG